MSEQTTYPQSIIPNNLELNASANSNLSGSNFSNVINATESANIDLGFEHAFPNPNVCDSAPLSYDYINKTTGFIRQTSYNNGVLDLITTESMLKGIKVVEHRLDIEQAFKLGEELVEKDQQQAKVIYPLVIHKFNSNLNQLEVSSLAQQLEKHRAEQDRLMAQSQINKLETSIEGKETDLIKQDQIILKTEQRAIVQGKAQLFNDFDLNLASDVTKVDFNQNAVDQFIKQSQKLLHSNNDIEILDTEIQSTASPGNYLQNVDFYDDTENNSNIIPNQIVDSLDQTLTNDELSSNVNKTEPEELAIPLELYESTEAGEVNDVSFYDGLVDTDQAISNQATTTNFSSSHIVEESTGKVVEEDIKNLAEKSEQREPVSQIQDSEPSDQVSVVQTPDQSEPSDQASISLADTATNIGAKAPIVLIDPTNPNLTHSQIVNLIDTARQFNPVDIEHKLKAQQKLAQELKDSKHKKLVPYALIVFGNDAMCFSKCLDSVRSYCKRGVLIYNETTPGIQDDGSIELAQEFVDNNPGFRLYRYPVPIIPQNFIPLMDKLLNGSVHRYWLIDCMYNYGLLHIHKLAEENGDYDNALVFNVDPNVIYNASSLDYVHTILETHTDQIDYITFDQVNVVGDYRKGKTSGIKKLFSVFLSHKRPSIKNAWFRKIDHMNSHFLCKLSKLSGFGTKFVIPVVDNHAEYDLSQPQVLTHFRYELDIKFTNDIKGFSGISDHDISTKILVGFNFKEDRNYIIEGDNVIYNQGQEYEGLPEDVLTTYKSIIEIDPEFWTKANLLDLYSDFRLPVSLEPASYLSDNCTNLNQLFTNKLYTMESFLVGFNARLDALHPTDPDYVKFSSDKYVLMRLLNELTVDVDISYIDCSHLVVNKE